MPDVNCRDWSRCFRGQVIQYHGRSLFVGHHRGEPWVVVFDTRCRAASCPKAHHIEKFEAMCRVFDKVYGVAETPRRDTVATASD